MQERVGVISSSWVHTCTGYVSSGCINTDLVTASCYLWKRISQHAWYAPKKFDWYIWATLGPFGGVNGNWVSAFGSGGGGGPWLVGYVYFIVWHWKNGIAIATDYISQSQWESKLNTMNHETIVGLNPLRNHSYRTWMTEKRRAPRYAEYSAPLQSQASWCNVKHEVPRTWEGRMRVEQ